MLGSSGWSTSDYLLADLFHAQAGTPHPGRPKPDPTQRQDDPARRRARTAALARKRQREQDIAEGRIT